MSKREERKEVPKQQRENLVQPRNQHLFSMASTIKRRRFQAPITSFFTSQASSSPEASSNRSQSYENLPFPPLPDALQSSLLTVGMRIRKSVPEGYKTHKTVSSIHPYNPHSQDMGNPKPATSSTTYTYTELTPFCGLHKIGGMAIQPMPPPSNNIYTNSHQQRPAEEEFLDPWSLPSSQESIDSSTASAPPSNKRAFFEFNQDDEDDHAFGEEVAVPSSYYHINPSYPFGDFANNTNTAVTNRAFAIPRSRSSHSQFNKDRDRDKDRRTIHALNGQENLGHALGSKTLELDFGEASFLQAREDVDVDDLMID